MDYIFQPQAAQFAEMGFLTQLTLFLPKLLLAVLILLLGILIARALRSLTIRLISALNLSSAVESTPVEHFLKNADLAGKMDHIVGSLVYWLVILVVVNTIASVLGLTSLSILIERILFYIPNVIVAFIVLVIGVLLAGVVESLVKGMASSIDAKSARILGKLSGYLVVTIAMLIALSELGIAQEFIIIAFIGMVASVSLAFGLALGLGGQDLVRQVLGGWYQRVSYSQTKKNVEETVEQSKVSTPPLTVKSKKKK